MATHGQTINDRLNAARYAIAGQGLARCVCKATTEQVIGPKKKHLDYLIQCTQEANVSIPQLANLLIERTNHTSWVVVFKALVTVHHLMCHGSERFTQYLASSNYTFQLSSFQDKTAPKDSSMSTFIRRYSKYINEKALSYRNLAFDLCKIKRGTDGVMRNLPTDKLLKTIPILQSQLDSLLEFDCTANDLNNGVINAAFMQLYRDLISLYACHSDGMITILAKYFVDLNKKQCKEAYEMYKKFVIQMDKVSDFLKVAEAVGVDRDNIPDLMRVPAGLLDSLVQHLNDLDSSSRTKLSRSIVGNTHSSTSKVSSSLNAISGVNTAAIDDFNALINDNEEEEVRKALEDEAKALQQFKAHSPKSQARTLTGSSFSKNSTSSFGGASVSGFGGSLFSTSDSAATIPKIPLLQPPLSSSTIKSNSNVSTGSSISQQNKGKNLNNNNDHTDLLIDIDFENAFKSSNGSSAPATTSSNLHFANQVDMFGDLLQPVPSNNDNNSMNINKTGGSLMSGNSSNFKSDNLFSQNLLGHHNISASTGTGGSTSIAKSTGLFKGDLDSTLANLAQNLTFDAVPKIKK